MAISWGLFILIWLVQLIIYPGLHRIPSRDFSAYHRWYVKRISAVVLPLMAAELLMAAWWLKSVSGSLVPAFSAFMVFIVWLSTFTIQVQLHNRLKYMKDDTLIRRLVVTNWLRTLAWSIKAVAITLAVLIP